MTDELALKILAEIAAPGSGHLFSRRGAAAHAIDLIAQQAARIAELEAITTAKRGTSAQILMERDITTSSINGAMAFGYQNTNPPPSDDHWLAPFWKIGRTQAELEARIAANGAKPVAPVEFVGVAELLAAGEGHWQPCSGCYDTEDGHPTQRYAYSAALSSSLGNGCSECGGLGAVWLNYADLPTAEDLAELEDAAPIADIAPQTCIRRYDWKTTGMEQSHDGGWILASDAADSAMAKDAERYRWLRNEHFPTADNPPLAQVVWKELDDRHGSLWANIIDGNDLDAAIDAAIAASAEKTGD